MRAIGDSFTWSRRTGPGEGPARLAASGGAKFARAMPGMSSGLSAPTGDGPDAGLGPRGLSAAGRTGRTGRTGRDRSLHALGMRGRFERPDEPQPCGDPHLARDLGEYRPAPGQSLRWGISTSRSTLSGSSSSGPPALSCGPTGPRRLAVATNGGLAISSNATSLAIGIRPTNLLDYSPLIATADARTWSAAGPIGPLADHPDALALNATGGALALVGAGIGDQVLASPGALSGWRVLVTSHQLAGSKAGHTCGVTSVTAVGYLGSDELVGAACRHAGSSGSSSSDRAAGAWSAPPCPPRLRPRAPRCSVCSRRPRDSARSLASQGGARPTS